MDFIEQWFGLSPDGGSGAMEFLILVVAALAIVALAIALRRYFGNPFAERRNRPEKRDRDDHSNS